MGKDSKIEWTDHTFNPWIGCTRVSPGCVNCYAEQMMDKRLGKVRWGVGQPRKRTSVQNWNAVRRWNEPADRVLFVECVACGHRGLFKWREILGAHGQVCGRMSECAGCKSLKISVARPRVFCASLADWLDPEVPVEWLADLLALIHETPNLDWLLLTKRPGLWRERVEKAHDYIASQSMDHDDEAARVCKWLYLWIALSDGLTGGNWPHKAPANVWIGTTVEDQRRADERIPELLRIPARVRFLSCEPLLGSVDLETINNTDFGEGQPYLHPLIGLVGDGRGDSCRAPRIHWVICGGESGPNARPMHPDWARGLRDQCDAAGVPFFFKQWGEWLPIDAVPYTHPGRNKPCSATAYLGDDGKQWPIGKEAPPESTLIRRVGKHCAGRLLDGREHSAFPEVWP